MIKEVKMYTVICDNCGKDVNADAEYSAWSDTQFTEDMALEAGWHKEDDKHYCPDCFSFDDEDELVINAALRSATAQTKAEVYSVMFDDTINPE